MHKKFFSIILFFSLVGAGVPDQLFGGSCLAVPGNAEIAFSRTTLPAPRDKAPFEPGPKEVRPGIYEVHLKKRDIIRIPEDNIEIEVLWRSFVRNIREVIKIKITTSFPGKKKTEREVRMYVYQKAEDIEKSRIVIGDYGVILLPMVNALKESQAGDNGYICRMQIKYPRRYVSFLPEPVESVPSLMTPGGKYKLGNNLKARMKRWNMPVRGIANRIGVDKKMVNAWLRGEELPTPSHMKVLEKVVKKSACELLLGISEDELMHMRVEDIKSREFRVLLGLKIFVLRNKMGLTEKEFGRKKRLEVSEKTVLGWESGASMPEPQYIEELAGIFNMTAGELLADIPDDKLMNIAIIGKDNAEDRKVFGLKIFVFRNKAKLTVKELSRMTGIASKRIILFETGKEFPEPAEIKELAQALKKSKGKLLGTGNNAFRRLPMTCPIIERVQVSIPEDFLSLKEREEEAVQLILYYPRAFIEKAKLLNMELPKLNYWCRKYFGLKVFGVRPGYIELDEDWLKWFSQKMVEEYAFRQAYELARGDIPIMCTMLGRTVPTVKKWLEGKKDKELREILKENLRERTDSERSILNQATEPITVNDLIDKLKKKGISNVSERLVLHDLLGFNLLHHPNLKFYGPEIIPDKKIPDVILEDTAPSGEEEEETGLGMFRADVVAIITETSQNFEKLKNYLKKHFPKKLQRDSIVEYTVYLGIARNNWVIVSKDVLFIQSLIKRLDPDILKAYDLLGQDTAGQFKKIIKRVRLLKKMLQLYAYDIMKLPTSAMESKDELFAAAEKTSQDEALLDIYDIKPPEISRDFINQARRALEPAEEVLIIKGEPEGEEKKDRLMPQPKAVVALESEQEWQNSLEALEATPFPLLKGDLTDECECYFKDKTLPNMLKSITADGKWSLAKSLLVRIIKYDLLLWIASTSTLTNIRASMDDVVKAGETVQIIIDETDKSLRSKWRRNIDRNLKMSM